MLKEKENQAVNKPTLLGERGNEILSLLIGDYIATSEAVGSRQLSKKLERRLSPATIRNVMSDLEELGYLSQPYTSAGRIPTQKGLRYYVDTLIEKRELNQEEKREITHHYHKTQHDIPSLFKQTSKMLATISKHTSLVQTPKWDKTVFKHLEFLPLSQGRVLGIFVAQNGMVENRILEGNENLTYSDLEKINNYCNACFVGLTLDEARGKAAKELVLVHKEYDRLLSKALLLAQNFLGEISENDLMIGGGSHLLDSPSLTTMEKVRQLLQTLEEKRQLLSLLDSCLESPGVRIFIGAESRCEAAHEMSLVTATYSCEGEVLGTLGVIGPTSMNYTKVIPMVDFTAKLVSDLLME